jgi:hypothetical protein
VVGQLQRAADQGGPAASASGVGRAALGAIPGAAHDQRVLSRLRELDMAWTLRPGGHSGSDSWPAENGTQARPGIARRQAEDERRRGLDPI